MGFAGILALEGRAGRNVVEPGYLVVSEAGERGKHGKNPDFCVSFGGLSLV